MPAAAGGRSFGRMTITNTALLAELAKLKQGARATWAAGDFPAVARRELWDVGPRIVERTGVRPGDRVLDVACGTGNVALRAAQSGAQVVGVDLTPELFEAGRRLAAEYGVAVDWVQGDAEELPAGDATFDVVLSTFGCMFAPRHEVAAAEIARVLAPGGRIGICSWTPEGATGRMFRMLGAYMPPPSPLAQPPVLWGVEDHVRELFAGSGIELGFARETVTRRRFGSTAEAIEWYTTKFGPLVMAREMLEAAGRWEELKAELARFYEQDEPAEYLVVTGRKHD
jgi:ubiquinone/menaquinone biosynthesis C-methylase UbiE